MEKIYTFGVAGNFTGHLEQAGEARDFVGIKAAAGMPKAVFPTYLPDGDAPDRLHTYPFDPDRVILPPDQDKVQIEPECAVIFKAEWNDGDIASLTAKGFCASNDCSIRREGARKISEKKNWGAASKGVSRDIIPVDSFDSAGIMDRYRIACFLLRDGEIHEYGEDSAVRDYSCIYGDLTEWLIEHFNHQTDEGPAEDIGSYLRSAGCPTDILVSIGATRYTPYGESHFLRDGDIITVMVYPEGTGRDELERIVLTGENERTDISVLRQTVYKA